MTSALQRRVVFLAICVGLIAGATACRRADTAIRLRSFQDPYFPEDVRVQPRLCTFRTTAGGDLHIVATSSPDLLTDDVVTVAAVETRHLLHVHVYWQPRPGKTFADDSTANAVLTYQVERAEGTLVYVGAGFAYPQRSRDGDKLTLEVKQGQLRLDRRSGELPDFLGPTQVELRLRARADAATTAAVMRLMHIQP